MYALVAHIRTTPDAAVRQVVYELRSFTCFNGFNQANAFRFQSANRNLLLSIDAQDIVVGNPIHSPTANQCQPSNGYGEWQCLGIGWLQYNLSQATGNPIADVSRGGRYYDVNFCKLMAKERCHTDNNMVIEGSRIRTLRELTPNERILANIGAWFNQAHLQGTDYEGTKRSILSATFNPNHVTSAAGMLLAYMTQKVLRFTGFDFVGSERPSGLAIAYLQVYRNLCSEAAAGFTSWPAIGALTPALLLTHNVRLIRQGANNTPVETRGIKSYVPLFSYLINHGSDSDILSYAGSNVCSYMTAHGFWNNGGLFRNPNSMLIEGRYDKGGQSEALRDNFAELVRSKRVESGNRELWPTSGADPFRELKQSVSSANELEQLLSMQSARMQQTATEAQRLNYIQRIGQQLQSFWSNNPQVKVDAFQVKMASLPDLSQTFRATPATVADGAAMGYHQWVDSATVH